MELNYIVATRKNISKMVLISSGICERSLKNKTIVCCFCNKHLLI